MYILIFIFAFSLLGIVSMIGFKILVLRKYGITNMPGRTTLLSEQAHSLERHLGAFLRTRMRQYWEKIIFWIRMVCIPAIIRIAKNITALFVYAMKYIFAQLFHREDVLQNKTISHNSGSSFFLKDITEHKKNLKNENSH